MGVEAERLTAAGIDPLLPAVPTSSMDAELTVLYREHAPRLIRVAAAITLNGSLAEDVTHDAFVGLQRRFGTVDRPVAYLQRSVVNLSLKVLRRRKIAVRYQTPADAVSLEPEIEEAWEAVVRLPPRQRVVVALRYWNDLSEAEIADYLGWPAGTVKSTLHRALKRLKEDIVP
jgi:RNA polymerase sigma factor (sigma-70 family)